LSTTTVTVYRKKDGLFDEVIHQILEDDFGRLWMSTNRGIFWVPREQLNAFADGRAPHIISTSYTERDGMRSREANGGMQPAGIRASDGRLWWPTQDGAVVVDPSRIQRNKVPPPVVIEAITSDETLVNHFGGSVRLQAGQRDFEIVYTALSFMAPENVRFKYRLEGFNNDWVQASNRRTAFYTNVPPGQYHFQVMASNNDGVWNETGVSLAVTIDPHIYETRWFMLLMAALTIVLIWAGYTWRTRRLVARERVLKGLVAARTRDLEREKEATETERERADEQRIAAEHLRELAEQARATVEAQAEKLKTLDEAKSLFFANVSHEFRTPLTLIIGPLEDLLKGLHGELASDMREELELSLRNGRLLLRLVNQILDIAKLEAGQMKLRAERVDLAALLEHTTLAFSSLAERNRIRFQVETPGDPIWICGDPDMLEKVFTNLLSNAFKFTPEKGTVRLEADTGRAGDETGEIDVIVNDSGAGIPPAKLPHVFERFYEANESASSWQPGTGIGLALARDLVDLHGGRIDVESEEGIGSTFTVTLKCGRSHLKPEDIAEPPEDKRPRQAVSIETVADDMSDARPPEALTESNDVTTVLVIDDNPEIRMYIRRHLEPTYRVIEAVDGVDGLESTRRWLPDIVISDVMMPKMDGYAYCESIKNDLELDYIPVILLTAKATTEEKINGLELGADDYLTKPFDVNELRARVFNLVESRLRLRDSFRRDRATVHASEASVTSSDEALLEQLREAVEAEMSDEGFTVDRLAERIGMSRGHLHRRLRDLLGETPTDLIRRIRLERAMQLLAGRAGSVSEVAYGVGFKSVSHFSKCFREHAGVTPSQYIAQSSPPNH
jgi:signal transduction histidine kinase/AraC-like DNA-binding protein